MSGAPKTELLQSLGTVLRALSALFWTLPLALIAYVQTARTDWLGYFGWGALIPAMFLTGVLWRALGQMRAFQPQEAVWRRALDRASAFAALNLGLAPFLYLWHRLPSEPLFSHCVGLLALSSLLLLIQINHVLRRLTDMLPDETLRSETLAFTRLNIAALSILLGAIILYFLLLKSGLLLSVNEPWFPMIDTPQPRLLMIAEAGLWPAVLATLMPLAITMSLLWRIKETLFASVFGHGA